MGKTHTTWGRCKRSLGADQLGTNKTLILLFAAAIFSVCVGRIPFLTCSRLGQLKVLNICISIEMEDWAELEEQEKAQEHELLALDRTEQFLAASGSCDPIQRWEETSWSNSSSILLPRSLRDSLLHVMEDGLLGKLSSDIQDGHKMSLTSLFSICTVLLASIHGAFHANMHR
eukprot:Gb_40157 [translate_table: standard]